MDWYEREIEKRGKSYVQIFRELHEDKDKPYLAGHESFDAYCLDRWGLTARRVRQVMAAADSRALLVAMTAEDPELNRAALALNDSQVSVLNGLPPPVAAEVLKNAIERPGKMTAGKMKQAKARVVDPVVPEAPAPAAPLPMEPAVDKCPGGNGTDVPEIVPAEQSTSGFAQVNTFQRFERSDVERSDVERSDVERSDVERKSTIAEDAAKAAALETDLVDGEPDAFVAGWIAGYERAMVELVGEKEMERLLGSDELVG